MFTIFHVFRLVGPISGVLFGFNSGRHFGIAGTLVGAVVGCCVGLLAGRLPSHMADWFMFRRLKAQSTQQLWSDLQGDACLTPNYVLFELQRRGEPMEQGLEVVLSMLTSEDRPRRLLGFAAFLTGFPEFGAQMCEYNPDATDEKRREAVNDFRNGCTMLRKRSL